MELKMMSLKQLKAGDLYRRSNDDKLKELQESIKSKGVMFPLVAVSDGKTHKIVDGNRRFRACRELKLQADFKIPVLLIKTGPGESVEAALIANTVRADADPLAEVEAVNLLVNEYGRDVKEVAANIGKSERYIWRLISIYQLPQSILKSLRQNDITLAHAHWLTRLKDKPGLLNESFERAVSENLTSRDLETLVANLTAGDNEENGYNYFNPKIVTTKAGSRLRFEPRRRSVRVECNINLDEPIDVILAEIKRNLKKLARGRLRVVG